jgi:predicted RNA-binding Zn-ribbon protein involved in translation (DUF1610 family)
LSIWALSRCTIYINVLAISSTATAFACPTQKVEALIENDAEVLAMWRAATTAPVGKPSHNNDNVSIKPRHGNSLAYTLDRLERQRPDLFARVVAKQLSANAAAIEAGFRKKPVRCCPNCGHRW